MRAAALGLVLVLASACGGGGGDDDDAQQARAAECQKINDLQARRGDAPVGAAVTPTVSVLGDSYAQGFGLDDPRLSWPDALGDELRAGVLVRAVSGSGFTGSTYCDGTSYPDRVGQVVADKARTVVVEGGLNDTSRVSQVKADAVQVLTAVAGSKRVLVGPPLAPARDPEQVRAVDAALREAATEVQVPYVSLVDEQFTYLPDKVHVTQAGQDQIGRLVAQALS